MVKYLKGITILLLLFTGLLNLKAQDQDESPVITPKTGNSIQEPKLSYHLTMGTNVMYAKGYGTGMSGYVSPELSYKLTPRFRVNAGVMFFQTKMGYINYQMNYSDKSVVVKSPPTSGALAYVSGDYAINNRLTFSGMVIRDMNNLGGNSTQQSIFNTPYQAVSMHLDYKLTDHISIGAGVRMSQGNRWNYPSPYNGYNYNSPYSSNLFGL